MDLKKEVIKPAIVARTWPSAPPCSASSGTEEWSQPPIDSSDPVRAEAWKRVLLDVNIWQ
jgi:hypothetical protein